MINQLSYQYTPTVTLQNPLFDGMRVKFLVKREDLNHPSVSGNKWWKLKYNLEEARRENKKTLLTFGGAFSNHIYATAAAAAELGFESIGIIRGELAKPLNDTLAFAQQKGMHLHYISRDEFRSKTEIDFVEKLRKKFGDFYLIPEGGTNELAVKGCAELAAQLQGEIDFDYLCLPVGTGGTMGGMIAGLKGDKEVIGFSTLKGGDFLKREVARYVNSEIKWQIETDYHFGGYGKINQTLRNFILSFEKEYDVPLDPVYNGKAMFGVMDLLEKGFFKKGSKILFLHTGGLQGKQGFNF
jgi:1-aminocyclopropane-1-carboxylate deaminase